MPRIAHYAAVCRTNRGLHIMPQYAGPIDVLCIRRVKDCRSMPDRRAEELQRQARAGQPFWRTGALALSSSSVLSLHVPLLRRIHRSNGPPPVTGRGGGQESANAEVGWPALVATRLAVFSRARPWSAAGLGLVVRHANDGADDQHHPKTMNSGGGGKGGCSSAARCWYVRQSGPPAGVRAGSRYRTCNTPALLPHELQI